MLPPRLSPTQWRTSSFSNGGGNCVEVAHLPGGAAVRDSKDREAGHLRFERAHWKAFIESAKQGDLDA